MNSDENLSFHETSSTAESPKDAPKLKKVISYYEQFGPTMIEKKYEDICIMLTKAWISIRFANLFKWKKWVPKSSRMKSLMMEFQSVQKIVRYNLKSIFHLMAADGSELKTLPSLVRNPLVMLKIGSKVNMIYKH